MHSFQRLIIIMIMIINNWDPSFFHRQSKVILHWTDILTWFLFDCCGRRRRLTAMIWCRNHHLIIAEQMKWRGVGTPRCRLLLGGRSDHEDCKCQRANHFWPLLHIKLHRRPYTLQVANFHHSNCTLPLVGW